MEPYQSTLDEATALTADFDLITHAVEIIRIGTQFRQHFVDDDRLRNAPERVELNGLDLVLEEERLMLFTADDDAHRQLFLVIVVIVDHEGRLVDEDVARTEFVRQPAQLLHSDDQLLDLRVVVFADHGANRRLADDAV